MAKTDRTFQFNIRKSANEVLTHTKANGMKHHATFFGDEQAGTFSIPIPVVGELVGEYRFADQAVHIRITEAPRVLSWARIEREMRTLLQAAE